MAYTSQAEMESIFGDLAVLLRSDDDHNGSIDSATLSDVIDEATEIVQGYLFPRYEDADLTASKWVRRRTSYIAVWLLSQRRGNPAQYAERVGDETLPNTILWDLHQVTAGYKHIPSIQPRFYDGIAISNIVVDQRSRRNKIRVDHHTSSEHPGNIPTEIDPWGP